MEYECTNVPGDVKGDPLNDTKEWNLARRAGRQAGWQTSNQASRQHDQPTHRVIDEKVCEAASS